MAIKKRTDEERRKAARAILAKRKREREREATSKMKSSGGRETRLDWNKVMSDNAKLKRSGGSNFLKLEKGRNEVRFLMNPDGESFYINRQEAYLPVGGRNGKGQTVISPRTDDPHAYCPLIVVSDALRKVADNSRSEKFKKRALDLARRIRPRGVWYSNVLIKDGNQWNVGVLSYGQTVFQGVVTGMSHLAGDSVEDGMLEDGNIAHPDTGQVVIIERTGEKMNTSYAVTVTPKGMRVTDEQLAQRADLESFTECTDPGDIEEALCTMWGVDSFDELTSDAIEDLPLPSMDMRVDEDDDKPRRKKQPKRRPVDEDDDEDEDEDDEEETPPRRSKKEAPKKRRAVEEDDDDEDDEEELPRVRKAAKKAAPKKKRRLVEEDDDEDEDEDDDGLALGDDDVPGCIGDYPNPEKGLKCSKCEHRTLCKELVQG